eukprot:m.61562 g.61562  ORF g.61562 m.61562 type:complete len:369 (+) comp7345_c1_seq1:1707-2813(+)
MSSSSSPVGPPALRRTTARGPVNFPRPEAMPVERLARWSRVLRAPAVRSAMGVMLPDLRVAPVPDGVLAVLLVLERELRGVLLGVDETDVRGEAVRDDDDDELGRFDAVALPGRPILLGVPVALAGRAVLLAVPVADAPLVRFVGVALFLTGVAPDALVFLAGVAPDVLVFFRGVVPDALVFFAGVAVVDEDGRLVVAEDAVEGRLAVADAGLAVLEVADAGRAMREGVALAELLPAAAAAAAFFVVMVAVDFCFSRNCLALASFSSMRCFRALVPWARRISVDCLRPAEVDVRGLVDMVSCKGCSTKPNSTSLAEERCGASLQCTAVSSSWAVACRAADCRLGLVSSQGGAAGGGVACSSILFLGAC